MRPIVIVHGWDAKQSGQSLWDQVYGDLRDHLASAGFNVHGPLMPKSGNQSGDAITNAVFVRDYMDTHNLDDVVVVGHSYGGMAVEYLARVLGSPRMTGYATLDSAVHEWPGARWPYTKIGPWLINPPDQWAGSAVRNAIASAPERPDLSPLNVWINSIYGSPGTEYSCNIHSAGDHLGMVSHAITKAAVANYAARKGC